MSSKLIPRPLPRESPGQKEPLKDSIQDLQDAGEEDLQILELTQDDMAYDADLDIIRPYEYEEVGSGSDQCLSEGFAEGDTEACLTDAMKKLYCNTDQTHRYTPTDRRMGKKRRSKEMESDDLGTFSARSLSDSDLTELVNEAGENHHAKRHKATTERLPLVYGSPQGSPRVPVYGSPRQDLVHAAGNGDSSHVGILESSDQMALS